jgi:hypothetical protein
MSNKPFTSPAHAAANRGKLQFHVFASAAGSGFIFLFPHLLQAVKPACSRQIIRCPRIRILCTDTAARDSRTTSCNANICSWRGACSGHGAPQANCQRLSLLSSVQRRLSRTLAPRASLVHQCTRSELARMHRTDGNTTSQRNHGALQHGKRLGRICFIGATSVVPHDHGGAAELNSC